MEPWRGSLAAFQMRFDLMDASFSKFIRKIYKSFSGDVLIIVLVAS